MASPVIADPFHRMKYMERHGSGLRKIVRETEKPPGYTAAYNPKIFSTATDFRVILKNVNYQLSQKNLVNDQVSEQDKSPDIPHTVLNLCIHLIAHGSEGAQITHAHSIMGNLNKVCFFIHAKSSLYNRLLDIAKTAFQKQLTSKSTVF